MNICHRISDVFLVQNFVSFFEISSTWQTVSQRMTVHKTMHNSSDTRKQNSRYVQNVVMPKQCEAMWSRAGRLHFPDNGQMSLYLSCRHMPSLIFTSYLSDILLILFSLLLEILYLHLLVQCQTQLRLSQNVILINEIKWA